MQPELRGDRVLLRPLSERDLRERADWTADEELVSLMGADPAEQPFVSLADERRRNADWFRERLKAGDQLYAIEADGRYIGDVDVEFLPDAHKAELTVFIGDRAAWGHGWGTESARFVLKELRREPGVDCVDVDVPGGNERSLSFWEKLGFLQYRTDEDGRRWLRLSFD